MMSKYCTACTIYRTACVLIIDEHEIRKTRIILVIINERKHAQIIKYVQRIYHIILIIILISHFTINAAMYTKVIT